MSKIRRFSFIIYILTIPVAALACGRQQGQNSCQGEAADSTTCSSSSEPSPVANSRAPVPQDLAPLPGTGPVFAYISDHGYLVSWTAATDDRTAGWTADYLADEGWPEGCAMGCPEGWSVGWLDG